MTALTSTDITAIKKAAAQLAKTPYARAALVLHTDTDTVLEVHLTVPAPTGFTPTEIEQRYTITIDASATENYRQAPPQLTAVAAQYRSDPTTLASLANLCRPGDRITAKWLLGNNPANLTATLNHDTVTLRIHRNNKFLCELPFADTITEANSHLTGFNTHPYATRP